MTCTLHLQEVELSLTEFSLSEAVKSAQRKLVHQWETKTANESLFSSVSDGESVEDW